MLDQTSTGHWSPLEPDLIEEPLPFRNFDPGNDVGPFLSEAEHALAQMYAGGRTAVVDASKFF